MFQILTTNYKPPAPPVLRKAYDALEAMRITDECLTRAIKAAEEPKDEDDCLEVCHLSDLKACVRTFGHLFQEITSGPPTVPESAFRAIRDWEQRVPWSLPGLEPAMLASLLAVWSLRDAMDLSIELDGEEPDDLWYVIQCAETSIESATSLVDSTTVDIDTSLWLRCLVMGLEPPSVAEVHARLAKNCRDFLEHNPHGTDCTSVEYARRQLQMLGL